MQLKARLVLSSMLMVGVASQSGLSRAQDSVSASPDITVELGTTAQTTADEQVAVDNLLGIVVLQNLGVLPEATDVTAYGRASNGDHLLAFETTVELPGPVFVRRGDVVRYDGATYVIEFDANMAGVPDGTITDAVAESSGLLLSFGTTVDLGGVVAADEDVMRWNGSSFSLVFDGSSNGIDPALDLDAVDDAGGESLWISLDGHGSVGGRSFADEDVLLFYPSGPSWAVVYDGSAQDSDWAAADLDAVFVPEPGVGLSLLLGAGLLFGSRTQRRG